MMMSEWVSEWVVSECVACCCPKVAGLFCKYRKNISIRLTLVGLEPTTVIKQLLIYNSERILYFIL